MLYMIFEIGAFGFPQSISMTYFYASCITPFMIILGSAGVLLICYNGYSKQDAIVCTLAGIFGLCVCLFPCDNANFAKVGTFQLPTAVSHFIHMVSAIVFFALLSYNSLFLFTKSNGTITREKKIRNIIFRVCGIGMLASFVLIIPLSLLGCKSTFWIVEAIALMFFGVSWLTKSQCYNWLFKDKTE